MPDYQKIRVRPTKPDGALGGRGMHCDERKVSFTPTKEDGALVLRGAGYDAAAPDEKVLARPTKADGALEFRSITDCARIACVPCWECLGDANPGNLTDTPTPVTSLDIVLSGFPGGDGCCANEFDGVRFNVLACDYLPDPATICYGVDQVGGCPVPESVSVNNVAWWAGRHTGYYQYCDTAHPGDLQYTIEFQLSTYCDESGNYWAQLLMTLYVHGSHPVAPVCCMPTSGTPDTGEGRCMQWQACWQIPDEAFCGNFGMEVQSALCCCYPTDYPCECVDFYILAHEESMMRLAAAPAGEPVALKMTAPRPIKKKTIFDKAISFLQAVTGPTVPEDVYQQRLAICRSNACGHLRTVGEDIYCGACGCGKWRLAELRSKLRYANLECPCDPPLWMRSEK